MSGEEANAEKIQVLEAIQLSEDESDDFSDDFYLDDFKHEENDINDLDTLMKDKLEPMLQCTICPTRIHFNDGGPLTIEYFTNFLLNHQMSRTLEVFQQEFYEFCQKGKCIHQDLVPVSDVYYINDKFLHEIKCVAGVELKKAKIVAQNAQTTFHKLRKERDLYKLFHRQVQQEQQKLNHKIQKLQVQHIQNFNKYQELSKKYSSVLKEKMLLKLERDRLVFKHDAMQISLQNAEEKLNLVSSRNKVPQLKMKVNNKISKLKVDTFFPPDEIPNPYTGAQIEPQNYRNAILSKTFKAHMMAISSMDMHPKKSILATASDDFTWKIWTLPLGELIMSGEGHKDWVSGIHFHPKGTHLITSSGDCTIKVWDFINSSCTYTFKDHIQPVFSVKFNYTGEFFVSASMDQTCKVFDVASGNTRHTFKGHVDSVNYVSFQPYSNIFASASADKTISLWDIRSGLCVQTFYGHLNSVNHTMFSFQGDSIASCDADGIIKIWDVKMVKGRSQFNAGPYSANTVAWDQSGTLLLVGSDDQKIRMYNDKTQKNEIIFKGHEDAVQDVAFDTNGKRIISCGSDATFRIYQ